MFSFFEGLWNIIIMHQFTVKIFYILILFGILHSNANAKTCDKQCPSTNNPVCDQRINVYTNQCHFDNAKCKDPSKLKKAILKIWNLKIVLFFVLSSISTKIYVASFRLQMPPCTIIKGWFIFFLFHINVSINWPIIKIKTYFSKIAD